MSKVLGVVGLLLGVFVFGLGVGALLLGVVAYVRVNAGRGSVLRGVVDDWPYNVGSRSRR